MTWVLGTMLFWAAAWALNIRLAASGVKVALFDLNAEKGEALAAERRWAAGLPAPQPAPATLPHRRSWARLNQVAGLPRNRG